MARSQYSKQVRFKFFTSILDPNTKEVEQIYVLASTPEAAISAVRDHLEDRHLNYRVSVDPSYDLAVLPSGVTLKAADYQALYGNSA